MNTIYLYNSVILLVATTIFGLEYISVQWSLNSMGPIWVIESSLLLSSLFSLPFFPWKEFNDWKVSFVAGALLEAMFMLQALSLKYTSINRSAFLISTAVLFIPMIERLIWKHKTTHMEYGFCCIGLLGIAIMCKPTVYELNLGDLAAFGAALCLAIYTLWIDQCILRVESTWSFSLAQLMVAAIIGLPTAFGVEVNIPTIQTPFLTLVNIVFIAIFCNLLACFLRIKSQKVLKPLTVGIIMLFESPLAVIFSWGIFNQKPALHEVTGATIIGLATLLSISTLSKRKKIENTALKLTKKGESLC